MLKLFLIICLATCFGSVARSQAEFTGPLSSWANVKSRFGAKGDGIADDTRAIQRALDSLSDRQVNFNTGKSGYSVVYLPAGKYRISNTLSLRGKIGVKIVGEDPLKTIILWNGNDKDTMLWANGSAYFFIGRLTFDPGGRKNMEGVGIHWKSRWNEINNISSASVNIELADLIFVDGFSKGISGGTAEEGTNQNDSEILINRCVFNRCSDAGVAIRGYNALDYWIWDCRFIKCNIGVSCNSGNYHVFRSYFKQSKTADVLNINSYYTSVRYCYSTGSNVFSLDNGKSSNPFKRSFQSNIILNPIQTPIQYYHTGKVTLVDNYCRVTRNSKVGAFLVYDTWAGTYYTVLEIGNVFENFKNLYTMPVKEYKVYKSGSRKNSKTDTLERSFLAGLSTTPKSVKRSLFTIPPGASSDEIQSIIDKAIKLKKRVIVHFPFGIYSLDKEIVIKPGADIQLVGDGQLYASMIMRRKPAGYVNGSIFKVFGPSLVSFADLDLQTKDGTADPSTALAFFGIDQPGSALMIDQLYTGMDSSLLVRDCDQLYIQKTNSFFSGGTYLYGGPQSRSGKGNLRMACFGAQFYNTQVHGQASFMALDCWWEGDKKTPSVNYAGDGSILIGGAMIAPGNPDSNTVAIKVGKFTGRISLMDMYVQGKIELDPNNTQLDFSLWNINFYHKKSPLQFLDNSKPGYKGFFAGISSQCFFPKDPSCDALINTRDRTVNIETGKEDQFIESGIELMRTSKPQNYRTRPSGSSNIMVSRVSISAKFQSAISVTR